MAKVFLIHDSDGEGMADAVETLLASEPAETIRNPQSEPGIWEQALALFLLTPGLLHNGDQGRRARRFAELEIPVAPVVQDLRTYDFKNIPESHRVLGERNAVGLEPNSGHAVVETVRGFLGLESFAQEKKVFISYRRSDAETVAHRIYDYLWQNHFPTFLDQLQLEGGAQVQKRIIEALHDKDFVLLLDSPDAADSEWIRLEIIESMSRRIPMAVVCVNPDHRYVNVMSEAPQVNWEPDDKDNLVRVLRMVSRGIAGKVALDHRMHRVLQASMQLHGVECQELEPRRYLLSKDLGRLFLEYERSPITLERLHRLFLGCQEHGCETGIYVCGDVELFDVTRDALMWARGTAALDVVSIREFYTSLPRFFP